MIRRRVAAVTGVTLAAAAVLLAQTGEAATAAPAPAAAQGAHYTYRVSGAAAHAQQLQDNGFDVLEQRAGDDLFVLGDAGTADALRGLGLDATVSRTFSAPGTTRTDVAAGTYYGGYRTVATQEAHLRQVASAHADLATTVTYGQSWRKQHGRGGHDLLAICLTKKQSGDCALSPTAPKPRFFLFAQIHAREITTGDVAYRWIDYLVGNYGSNADVTALMNSTEMWVVPIGNPDGVDIVESGGNNPVLQRKNADDAIRNCGTGNTGVDLNRNAGSHWGYSGSSTNPCGETYRGPSADSEIENSALESLISKLYPDKRGTGDSAAAPADTRGMFITLHSDAAQVIFPWGHDARVHTGNDADLRSFGRQLGSQLGYQSGQAGEILYNASGGTDDWVYGTLGVASYTIEVGDSDGRGCDGFLPSYSCQASYFWPKMLPGLMLAAKKATKPYTR